MRRSLGIAVLAVAAAIAPGLIVGQPAARATAATGKSRIHHVVIIYQENHSFDEVLGAVCEQRSVPCNGSTAGVTFADGTAVPNKISPDIVPNMAHDPRSQRVAIGNQWDRIGGCTASAGFACVTHYEPSQIPNLARLADTYAVSDATFAAGDAASFGAHVDLSVGKTDGFVGYNPVPSTTGVAPVGTGWGCPSRKDARWSDGFTVSYQPSCVPQSDGTGAYRPTQVPYARSVMEQMEAAGLTWKVYNGGPKNARTAMANGTSATTTPGAGTSANRSRTTPR